MRRLAAALLRWLAETLVRLYYPRRTVAGGEHVPQKGPTLYVANHPNGLLDPLVLRVSLGRPARFLAKSTLWGNPFGRLAMDAWACLPVYRKQDMAVDEGGQTVARNEETFARCRAELAAGAELALYPEGGSHSEPVMRPLKTGAARIALSAAAAAETAGARQGERRAPIVVPVGLYYENKSTFRSGVHLVVGAPIDISSALTTFALDHRQGIEQLTDDMRVGLGQLVLQAETRELLAGIARVASWTGTDPDDDAPDRRHVRARELAAAYVKLQATHPERVEEVTRAARRYARTLERLGISDPWTLEIPRIRFAGVGTLLRGLLMTPLALWGLVTSWLPYRLSGVLAMRMTKDEDVLSTVKMICGAAFLVGAWIAEAFVMGWWFGAWWGLASLPLAPAAGYAALRWGETLADVGEVLRHLGWMARGSAVRRLAARRRRLAEEVAGALREASP